MRLPFFKTSPKKAGWLSIVRTGDAYLLAHVLGGGERPRVQAVFEFPAGAGAALEPIGKQAALKGMRVVSLLGPGEYQLLQAEAPPVPRPEWKAALQWKLQDMLDFPVEQATFDVLDIPTEAHAPGRQRLAYAVVARNEVVGPLMQSYDRAELGLEAIDVPELALRNISALLEEPNRGLACLNFDQGGGLLVLTFQGELYATRRIEISLDQLGRADTDRKNQLFERIGLELQRSLDAFDRQYSFISLTRLLIAPRPELAGLLDYLASSLYLPVDLLELGEKVDLSACAGLQQPVNQSRYLLAIGAALRDDGEARP